MKVLARALTAILLWPASSPLLVMAGVTLARSFHLRNIAILLYCDNRNNPCWSCCCCRHTDAYNLDRLRSDFFFVRIFGFATSAIETLLCLLCLAILS